MVSREVILSSTPYSMAARLFAVSPGAWGVAPFVQESPRGPFHQLGSRELVRCRFPGSFRPTVAHNHCGNRASEQLDR
jgi:hypothetical protein